jgi:hypothetical protein
MPSSSRDIAQILNIIGRSIDISGVKTRTSAVAVAIRALEAG